ncbi:hypothetical protein DH2020_048154 [Rehmannia glutinosa]|uniref:POX domain-containing protein n=1 Tax=Rehmannia glutinosa TaxID=99300 RepID=A0ABR0U7K8_REHGL
MGTQGLIHRNPGPLGPFTGYATILRSSKFLRPAQVLLDELCCGARCKNVEICRLSDKILEEVRVSGDSSGSLFGFNGLNDRSGANGGTGCWVDSYHQPVENLQKKAKLLYMQDEVCKRYKQYHQQMQMVVSSFESVAGLSAATPYVSLALKTVSKHFRCLKNAITDQLKSIRNALGEELLSSPNSAGTSTNKGDANVSMLKFFDQSFQKQKGSASLGINLDSQHVWRPQRGLPERAVSILRAWLFDHFLHPNFGCPIDQVSNWFINARVRVWKPMVEEIHMLETKGVAAADQTRTLDPPITANCDDKSNNITQSSNNRLRMITATPDNQVECSNIATPSQPEPDRFNPNAWNHESVRESSTTSRRRASSTVH